MNTPLIWLLISTFLCLALVFFYFTHKMQRKRQQQIIAEMSLKGVEHDPNFFWKQCLSCERFNQCQCAQCIYQKYCISCPYADCMETIEENIPQILSFHSKVVDLEQYRMTKERKELSH